MGVMYSEKHDYAKAIAAFESALKENPKFANAHLGLATAVADSGDLRRAFDVLVRVFSSSVVQDSRAMPTFERAGRFYRDLAKRLAQESIEAAEAEVESIAREAERVSGFSVQFEEGDFGVQMTASTEMAWKHGRDHHVIRIRESLDAAVKLHMRGARALPHYLGGGSAERRHESLVFLQRIRMAAGATRNRQ
jgi:tetratricopeptide (TPR) repeat protein